MTANPVSHTAGSGSEPGPLRLIWLEDGPHVVESVTQTEYAGIVQAGRRATPEEVQQWQDREWRVRE